MASLQIRQELGARHGIAYCLELIAAWAAAADRRYMAPKLWGAAERLREVIAGPLPPSEIPRYRRFVAAGRAAAADDAAFNAAWQEGRAMAMHEVIELAVLQTET